MKSDELQKHMIFAYLLLRYGIAFLALLFPVWLYVGGKLFGVHFPDEISMSAYYHAGPPGGEAPMRDWFVGLLFAIGIFMVLYRGFSNLENWMLNLTGIFAVGVAIFPMAWPGKGGLEYTLLGFDLSVHGTCAVLLFISIAVVAIWCAKKTLGEIPDEKLRERYKKVYKTIGTLMVVLPLSIFLLRGIFPGFRSYVFWVEMLGIWVFALYWLVKSREYSLSRVEELAVMGRLELK